MKYLMKSSMIYRSSPVAEKAAADAAANYKEPVAKTATSGKTAVYPVTFDWFNAAYTMKCGDCGRLVYPPHYVWMEGDRPYCFRCGSVRQDNYRRRIRENTRQLEAVNDG